MRNWFRTYRNSRGTNSQFRLAIVLLFTLSLMWTGGKGEGKISKDVFYASGLLCASWENGNGVFHEVLILSSGTTVLHAGREFEFQGFHLDFRSLYLRADQWFVDAPTVILTGENRLTFFAKAGAGRERDGTFWNAQFNVGGVKGWTSELQTDNSDEIFAPTAWLTYKKLNGTSEEAKWAEGKLEVLKLRTAGSVWGFVERFIWFVEDEKGKLKSVSLTYPAHVHSEGGSLKREEVLLTKVEGVWSF